MNITYKQLKQAINEMKQKKINEQAPKQMPTLQPAAMANLLSGVSKLVARDPAAAKALISKLPPDAVEALMTQLGSLIGKEEETDTQTATTPTATGALATSGE